MSDGESAAQTFPQRRLSDMQIHDLAIKVGHIEGTVQNQGSWIRDVDEKITRLDDKLSDKLDKMVVGLDAKTRIPMLPIVTLLVVAGGFLLTIMTLVTSQQGRMLSNLEHEIREHQDGHPVWVTKIMSEKFGHVLELIESANEQRLRMLAADADLERRLDSLTNRAVQLETAITEREQRIADAFLHRDAMREKATAERWTSRDEKAYQQGHAQLHEAERWRIEALEQLTRDGYKQ